jgi:DNA-directed RNA polymerase subunit alpha
VRFAVDNYRVEQRTDYEKLTLEILTDGSIAPKDALTEAAKILIFHFMLFSDDKIKFEEPKAKPQDTYNEELNRMRALLSQKLVDLDLSVRALNCLKAAEVDTLGELVTYHRADLLKFRNFGKKSLTELDELLEKNGLAFGMDITKYHLDE